MVYSRGNKKFSMLVSRRAFLLAVDAKPEGIRCKARNVMVSGQLHQFPTMPSLFRIQTDPILISETPKLWIRFQGLSTEVNFDWSLPISIPFWLYKKNTSPTDLCLSPAPLYHPNLPWFFHSDNISHLTPEHFAEILSFAHHPFPFNRFATFYSRRQSTTDFDLFAKFLLDLRPDGRIPDTDEFRELGLSFLRLLAGFVPIPDGWPSTDFVNFVIKQVLLDLRSSGCWCVSAGIFVVATVLKLDKLLEAPEINVPFDNADVVSEVYARFGPESLLWIYTTDHHNYFKSLTKGISISMDNAKEAIRRREAVSRQASVGDFKCFLDFVQLCVPNSAREFQEAAAPWDGCGVAYRRAWLLREGHSPAPARVEEPPPRPPAQQFPLPGHFVAQKDASLSHSQDPGRPSIQIDRVKPRDVVIVTSGPVKGRR
jgi:hypothetical protein